MSADREKKISLMIVPEDGTGVKNWRITTGQYRFLKIGIGTALFCLIAGIVSFVLAIYLFIRVGEYRRTNEELIEASSKIQIIIARLADYEGKERHLRRILGSDLELPVSMTVREIDGDYQVAEVDTVGGLYELEQAIAREEERLRHIPTIWPVDAWQITKEFSYTGNPRIDHPAIDLLAYEKSPVVATANGRVTFADADRSLGLMIEIDHGNGWVTRYGHNATLMVNYGDEVLKGQTIAIFGGNDPSGSGPHLHYAMFYNKQPVNPLDYLEPTAKMNVMKKSN